jgi:hypothetical protein
VLVLGQYIIRELRLPLHVSDLLALKFEKLAFGLLSSASNNNTMAPKSLDMHDRIRMDLLFRLRWDILAEVHHVKIAIGPEHEEKAVPLFDQPCVEEDIARHLQRHTTFISSGAACRV